MGTWERGCSAPLACGTRRMSTRVGEVNIQRTFFFSHTRTSIHVSVVWGLFSPEPRFPVTFQQMSSKNQYILPPTQETTLKPTITCSVVCMLISPNDVVRTFLFSSFTQAPIKNHALHSADS